MQNKNRLLLIFLIVFLSITFFFVIWRKNKLEQHLSHPTTQQKQELINNQFPITPERGEGGILTYWLECQIEQINQYRNYQRAPNVPGGWKVLADISCSYFNILQEVEIIHLPLHIYHPEKQKYLLVGTDMQNEPDEDKIRQIAEITSLGWYEGMTETFWGESIAIGKAIKIDLDYPSNELRMERTRGAAFETLSEPNPPYTKEGLSNFYQTGDGQFLPEVDGKRYFWPVVRYLLK